MSTYVPLPGPYRLTYADWLQFPDDGRLYEVIDGELLVTPPPNIRHQRASRELQFQIHLHLRQNGKGEVLNAPVGVRLRDDLIVGPDLIVILAEHADRIGKQVIDGAPDLVVEILSPGTAGRDLGTKRDAYAAAGVPEYWIVDPETRTVEVLTLDGAAYRRAGLYGIGDTLVSPVLDALTIDVGDVFRQ